MLGSTKNLTQTPYESEPPLDFPEHPTDSKNISLVKNKFLLILPATLPPLSKHQYTVGRYSLSLVSKLPGCLDIHTE